MKRTSIPQPFRHKILREKKGEDELELIHTVYVIGITIYFSFSLAYPILITYVHCPTLLTISVLHH